MAPSLPPDFNRLFSILNNSKLQTTNPPLYQVIKQLIDHTKTLGDGLLSLTSSQAISIDELDKSTVLTASDESAILPFSRNLLAGTNIAFNDAVNNQRTISATGSAAANSAGMMMGLDGIDGIDGLTAGLASSGVLAGSYGDSTHVAQITVNPDGRIIKSTSVAISGGAGAGSGLVLIQTQTLGSDTTVTFSSIPATYTHLRIVCWGRITEVASDDYIQIRFNNDSGSNYDAIKGQATSSNTFPIGAVTGATSGRIGDWKGASGGTADDATSQEIIIPGYASTTFRRQAFSTQGGGLGTGGFMFGIFAVNWHNSTDAINQIDLFPITSNFKTGSVFSLYGMI